MYFWKPLFTPWAPLFLIDLAVPRDVAPEVDSLYNVFVYNLDDIARIANENLDIVVRKLNKLN